MSKTPQPQTSEERLREKLASLDIEFLHGVPVKLPSSGIDAIMQAVKAELGAAIGKNEYPAGSLRQQDRNKFRVELRNHFGIGEEQA